MNKLGYYAIPIVLALGTILMVSKGVQVKKDSAIASSNIEIRKADTTKIEAAKEADIISAANAIEGFAAKSDLRLSVDIHNREIAISSEIKNNDGKEDNGDKGEILENYDGVTAFLTNISTLPYKMAYKSLCVGLDCKGAGLEAVISFGDAPPKDEHPAANQASHESQNNGQPQVAQNKKPQ